jgi:2-iminobutanoate/2-iminopropanoate deaminase
MTNKSIYLADPVKVDSTRHHLVPDAAVRGDLLFSGGVAGFDERGNLPPTHEDQAAQIYARLDRILDAAGFKRDEIGHWFNWAPDRHSKIGPINPHWERWFPNPASRPARHALARALDPGLQYRIEIIGVKGATRRSYEINDRIYHTGGTTTPGFMPFGTTMDAYLFTGPTYGMRAIDRRMGETPLRQAELCREANDELYRLTGHTMDELGQMFVWYHDEASRADAIRYTDVMFPDPRDRPAIHYIYSKLPYWPEVEGQFLIQYDISGLRGARRKCVNVPGVRVMDGKGGAVPAAVALGSLCFTSVILGSDRTSAEMPSDLVGQVRNAFANMQAVTEAAGFSLAEIGHLHVWYGDHAVREEVDRVWERVFPRPEDRPARHCIVADLPPGALVGIEAIAAR